MEGKFIFLLFFISQVLLLGVNVTSRIFALDRIFALRLD